MAVRGKIYKHSSVTKNQEVMRTGDSTLKTGGDSLADEEHWKRGESGERGGGVIGTLAGEVSGEASVEKGDCLKRMERSSEGLEKLTGGLRLRTFPRCKKGGGLREDVIRSITSMSKEGSSSRTGVTCSSSSISDCPASVLVSSTFSSSVLPNTPSSSWSSATFLLSESSDCDRLLSVVSSTAVAIGSNGLCDWLSSNTTLTSVRSVDSPSCWSSRDV